MNIPEFDKMWKEELQFLPEVPYTDIEKEMQVKKFAEKVYNECIIYHIDLVNELNEMKRKYNRLKYDTQ